EILIAQKDLASSEGIFAEPASCATLAGLYKLRKQGDLPKKARVVMVLTGNGLKDPEIVGKMILSPNEVAAEYETLREAILSC
ncbi:MAG: pyridoxal-phosphate dependent enzyme, partial [Acetomicrobium sp.]